MYVEVICMVYTIIILVQHDIFTRNKEFKLFGWYHWCQLLCKNSKRLPNDPLLEVDEQSFIFS